MTTMTSKDGTTITINVPGKRVTFTTEVRSAETKNATGIWIPAEAISALGSSKKPKVAVSLNGYTYRTTVAVYGDEFVVPLNAEHRSAARVTAGERHEITLTLDLEPRTVDVPDDLREALAAQPGANERFDSLAYSHRKEHVRSVNDARSDETRKRRIAAVVSKVSST